MAPLVVGGSLPSPPELAALFATSQPMVEAVFLVSAPGHAGFVRVFLPMMLVQECEVFAQNRPSRERLWRSIQGSRLFQAQVPVEVGIARARLSRLEVADLSVDDVLLPPHHALTMEGIEQGTQPARLYLDLAQHGYIQGTPRASASTGWSLEVTQTHYLHAEDMMASQDTSSSGAHEATSHLIDEAKVVVEVRVGRSALTVAEVGSLQAGQVLELGVPLGEPVSLLAGGKMIARGELVNVEGRLGVRVLARY